MNWRCHQLEYRKQYIEKWDAAEVDGYEALVGQLTREEEDAYLADLKRVPLLVDGMTVLDVGAGTGAMCKLLLRVAKLAITALEPAPAMLAKLRNKEVLNGVQTIQGFCDGVDDRRHFKESQFDAIVSRQVSNGLFDPLTAFKNWHYWLSPGGAVIVVDGLYGRSAWTGKWEDEIDMLPLSACQTTALTPYLLEETGFQIDAVEPMSATNDLPSTKTTRYIVVARKGP